MIGMTTHTTDVGQTTDLQGPACARVLLAGTDTLYFSFDVAISDDMHTRLEEEKKAAQVAASAGECRRGALPAVVRGAGATDRSTRRVRIAGRNRRLHRQAVGSRHPQPAGYLPRAALILPACPFSRASRCLRGGDYLGERALARRSRWSPCCTARLLQKCQALPCRCAHCLARRLCSLPCFGRR